MHIDILLRRRRRCSREPLPTRVLKTPYFCVFPPCLLSRCRAVGIGYEAGEDERPSVENGQRNKINEKTNASQPASQPSNQNPTTAVKLPSSSSSFTPNTHPTSHLVPGWLPAGTGSPAGGESRNKRERKYADINGGGGR